MSDSLVYFKAGKIVASSGDVTVYNMNNDLFLEIGPNHTLWALSSELEDYIWQLNDRPFGDCLEIGLGLGVASKYILSCPTVDSLTTIEINKDVIAVHNKINKIENKWYYYGTKNHTIINEDGLIYPFKCNKRYDFIFIDCYDRIDDETLPLIKDMVNSCRKILKKNGDIIGWFDKATPEEFVKEFFNIFLTT